jgi:stringent starvation protein B
MQYKSTLIPYLVNAFYTWSLDIGFTPLISVKTSKNNILPIELTNHPIVLNIHPTAVRNMVFSKETLEFEARFDGESYPIVIYYKTIIKIFNREDNYEINLEESTEKTKPNLSIVKKD